jgi:chemotaxis protein methyltransferase CheR
MSTPASHLRHIVFPREIAARRVINVAQQLPSGIVNEREAELPALEGQFLEWLFAAAGLCASDYRPETLMRRLPACLRMLHVSSVLGAQAVLARTPQLIPRAVDVMLVGVTSFFRDCEVFAELAGNWLPKLAEARGGITVWSVGCSDGAELYSIAMLLAERGLLSKSYLVGTDCRTAAIAHARAGRYSQQAIAGVPTELRERYFMRVGGAWEVTRELRAATRWHEANVLARHAPGTWDVILCRNTSIYVRTAVAHRLWQKLEASLRVGGLLVLGKAERPISATRLQVEAPCIFCKTRR